MARFEELNDYGFFQYNGNDRSILYKEASISIIRIHSINTEVVQNAFSYFILLNIYQNMFIRGVQSNITHAVIFDEAHRASKLKLIPTMAKECRKYGISFILSSQSAKDFSSDVFPAILNYLVLRVSESDANFLSKSLSIDSSEVKKIYEIFKKMDKFHAMFFSEESKRNSIIKLHSVE